MHVLTLPSPLDLGPQGSLPAGEYIVEDRNGAEIMLRAPGSTMIPLQRYIEDHADDLAVFWRLPNSGFGSNILIVAPIGFGDAILLTPCLRQIKQLHPQATLTVATLHEYRQPLLGLPYVDAFADYPLPLAQLSRYDCVLCLEGSVEFNPRAKEQHMTDRFAEHLGLGELKDKRADYVVSGAEREWVWASFPRTEKRRIGIQVQAGARCRTYPRIGLIVEALRRENWEVYLLGRMGEFRVDGTNSKGVFDLSRLGLTWRQSVAFLLTCDVVLAPDSSLLHAAGALGVPAVGLFGAFPWKLRTAYYEFVHALQGIEGCPIAPCFHSHHIGLPELPPAGPCAMTGRCTAIESILPSRIMAKINQIARQNPMPAPLPPAETQAT
jgi:ADP-heptose:LPS heptosyltransferase